MHDHSKKTRRRLAGAALFVLFLLAVALVAIPLWLIQPFSPQTPAGLAVSYAVRRQAPLATALALLAALPLAVLLWRNARWRARTAVVLTLVLLAGAAWAARQNVFERMFAPVDDARFVPAAEAGWVQADDPVMAVTLNGEAAAFPVRQIAYHHIVQDVVGGVPVAVTY